MGAGEGVGEVGDAAAAGGEAGLVPAGHTTRHLGPGGHVGQVGGVGVEDGAVGEGEVGAGGLSHSWYQHIIIIFFFILLQSVHIKEGIQTSLVITLDSHATPLLQHSAQVRRGQPGPVVQCQ